MKYKFFIALCGIILTVVIIYFLQNKSEKESVFLSYEVDVQKQDVQLYWKDKSGKPLKSIFNLREYLATNHETLLFAMNAGMYNKDHSPTGLFIQHGKILAPLNAAEGQGNFYLKPNGIFYITNSNAAAIISTDQFSYENVKFATQSGPILISKGSVHPAFQAQSRNKNIRNGVGVLPNGKLLFAMSKKEVNFYEFAMFFKNKGCRNALYLDGLVSRAYLPEKNWQQTDGDFGVIIGITKKSR